MHNPIPYRYMLTRQLQIFDNVPFLLSRHVPCHQYLSNVTETPRVLIDLKVQASRHQEIH